MFKSRLLYNRSDGAFVRLSVPIVHGHAYAEGKLQAFAKQVIQLIAKNWPEEQKK
jgi:hypothetical protein